MRVGGVIVDCAAAVHCCVSTTAADHHDVCVLLGQVMAVRPTRVFAEVYGSSLSPQLYSSLMLANHADVAGPVYNSVGAQLGVSVSISAATIASTTSSICEWLEKHSHTVQSFTVTLTEDRYRSSDQAIPLLAKSVTDLRLLDGPLVNDGFAVTLSQFLDCCRALRSVHYLCLSGCLKGPVARALLAALGRKGSSLVELGMVVELNSSLELSDVNSMLAQMTRLKRLTLGAIIDDLDDKNGALPALVDLTRLTKVHFEFDVQAGCRILENLPSSVEELACACISYGDQGMAQYNLSHLRKVTELAGVPLSAPQIVLPPNLVCLGASLGFVSPLLPLTKLAHLDLMATNRPGRVRQELQQLTALTGLQDLSVTYYETSTEPDFVEAWPLLPITKLCFPSGMHNSATAHLTCLSRLQRLEISHSCIGSNFTQAVAKLPSLELVLGESIEWG